MGQGFELCYFNLNIKVAPFISVLDEVNCLFKAIARQW
jgi:hypothetical protein